jgi:hypothetical protein
MVVIAVLAFACALVGIGYLVVMQRRNEPYYGMLAVTSMTVGAMFGAVHAAMSGF